MKYATATMRNRILIVSDQPPQRPHVQLTDEQAAKAVLLESEKSFAFLINGEITNFREQRSLGNSMLWNASENKWDITPIQ